MRDQSKHLVEGPAPPDNVLPNPPEPPAVQSGTHERVIHLYPLIAAQILRATSTSTSGRDIPPVFGLDQSHRLKKSPLKSSQSNGPKTNLHRMHRISGNFRSSTMLLSFIITRASPSNLEKSCAEMAGHVCLQANSSGSVRSKCGTC